jgi:hypothetical protein
MDPEKGGAAIESQKMAPHDGDDVGFDGEKYEKGDTMPELRYGINDIPPWCE